MDLRLFNNLIKKADGFYYFTCNLKRGNNFRIDRKIECENLNEMTLESISNLAVDFAYPPSVQDAVDFHGMDEEKEEARVLTSELIRIFLIRNFNSGYKMDEVYDLITKVRKTYREDLNLSDYTFGNAQKFVSLSFKMFFILLDHFRIRPITYNDDFLGYNYSIVDRQMIYVSNEDGIEFNRNNPSWSKCDDIEEFKMYQDSLQETYGNIYGNLVFYELDHWTPREDKIDMIKFKEIVNIQ